MKKYSDLLEDKKWQNKRQFILKRDENKCTSCGTKNKLQVHHIIYYADKPKPWLYPNKYLITLCDDCHKEYHLKNEVEIVQKETKSAKRKKKKRDKMKLMKKYTPLSESQMNNGLRIKPRITG